MTEFVPAKFSNAIDNVYTIRNVTDLLDDHKTNPVILIDAGVNKLVVECLKALSKLFCSNEEIAPDIIKSIPHFNRDLFMNIIPTDAPLKIVIPNISSEVYWKRRCRAKWPKTVYQFKEKKFKKIFCETYLSEFLENLSPGYEDYEEIKELCIVLHKYIFKLRIKSLHAGKMFLTTGSDCKYITEPEESNRIDFRQVLAYLPKLVELHLSFGMENSIQVSDIRQAVFSEDDFHNLGEAILLSRLLTVLKITSSLFRANDLAVLYHYVMQSNLMVIEIENCFLRNSGAQIVSLIIKNHPLLLKLSLKDNDITEEGIYSISYALTHQPKSKLQILDLSMNRIGDEGGSTLATAAAKHQTLEEIYLSGTRLGEKSGELFAKAIGMNLRIKVLDLSCNNFTQENAVSFLQALESNDEIYLLDLRGSGLHHETLQDIKDILFENRELKRQKAISKPKKRLNRCFLVKNYLKNLSENQKLDPLIYDPVPHYGSHRTSSLTLSDHGQITVSTLDSTSSESIQSENPEC